MPFTPEYFCTDEDVLLEAEGDFRLLVPSAQRIVEGSDGAISDEEPWVLTSAARDFEAQGVIDGMVCFLSGARGTIGDAKFGQVGQRNSTYGEPMVCGAPVAGSLSVHWPGLGDIEGQPPGSYGDMTGLTFQVRTLRPQISQWSDWARRELYADQTADLIDADDLRLLVVYAVLASRYGSQARVTFQTGQTNQGAGGDDFAAKSAIYRNKRDALLEKLRDRRGSGDGIVHFACVPIYEEV